MAQEADGPSSPSRLSHHTADVRGILEDPEAVDAFSLELWCKLTGLTPEDAERLERERVARGEPLAPLVQTKFDEEGNPTSR